jgi:hypothetical protein
MKILSSRIVLSSLLIIVAMALAGWIYVVTQSPSADKGQWIGVDEAVIEKYAATAGRTASQPLINTDKGDLLLFVFAVSAAAAGFAAGYCWRMLVSEKRTRS